MDPLEARALKKDQRFLWRLLLWLLVGVMAGLFAFSKLTDAELSSCAARGFESIADQ